MATDATELDTSAAPIRLTGDFCNSCLGNYWQSYQDLIQDAKFCSWCNLRREAATICMGGEPEPDQRFSHSFIFPSSNRIAPFSGFTDNSMIPLRFFVEPEESIIRSLSLQLAKRPTDANGLEIQLASIFQEAEPLPGVADIDKAASQAQEWLEQCTSGHGGSCSLADPMPLPTRILDLGVGELLDSDIKLYCPSTEPWPKERYVSLSHCWGRLEKPYLLTQRTLAQRQERIPFRDLPCTFQDAVIFVRKLGLRYLWIDSLCIIQFDEDDKDDHQDWEHESGRMISVYRNSYLTIASNATSNDGEGFLNPLPEKFATHQVPISTGEGRATGIINVSIYPPHCQPWRPEMDTESEFPLITRAWTFQERLLAPRVLNFTSCEVVYECESGSWCQCGQAESQSLLDEERSKSHLMRSLRQQGLSLWGQLLLSYSALNLTKEEDRLPALSGIATAMREISDLYAGDYLAGLWRPSLLQDLCWQKMTVEGRFSAPWKISPSGELSWPEPTNNSSKGETAWIAPSWSWVSAQSEVFYQFGRWAVPGPFGAEILHAETTPASLDPMGRVKTGSIRLRADVRRVTGEALASLVHGFASLDDSTTPVHLTGSDGEIAGHVRACSSLLLLLVSEQRDAFDSPQGPACDFSQLYLILELEKQTESRGQEQRGREMEELYQRVGIWRRYGYVNLPGIDFMELETEDVTLI